MKSVRKDSSNQIEIKNKKVFHDFSIGEKFEAGIVLVGSEVKSIRSGRCQINGSFARPNRHGELFLYNANIAEYKFSSPDEQNCTRPRKLLLHAKELRKIAETFEHTKCAILPLRVFFKNGIAKVDIALCKWKKSYDKRESIKNAEADREAASAISLAMRGKM
jgi:SsrA-binding protein